MDVCFFCLGVSSAGMKEADYRRVTYDLTLAAAEVLARLNRALTFEFVSGMGTDRSERGRVMWARVKGQTENALLRMPFKAAYMFRPGMIVPMHGIRSRTALYRVPYALMSPLLPLLRAAFPKYVTSTEALGRAMITVAKHGAAKAVLESADINAVLAGGDGRGGRRRSHYRARCATARRDPRGQPGSAHDFRVHVSGGRTRT